MAKRRINICLEKRHEEAINTHLRSKGKSLSAFVRKQIEKEFFGGSFI